MRAVWTAIILLAIFWTSTTAVAQTTERCPRGRDDVVPTPCGVLADQALQLDDVRARLRSCQSDLEERTGELNERGDSLTRCEDRAHRLTLEVGELRRPETARVPWQLRVGLDVALAAGGIATGAAVGSGAPVEWVVGFAVLEGGLLIARLVVEWLDRTPLRPGRS